MKLKKDIIERLKGNKDAIPALKESLQKSRQLITRMIRQNKDEGPLTTVKALNTIQSVLEIEDINDLVDREVSRVDSNVMVKEPVPCHE